MQAQLAQFESMKWRAGYSGDKPFYYSCCECESEDIVGALFNDTWQFEHILIKETPEGLFKLRLYCKDHIPQVVK